MIHAGWTGAVQVDGCQISHRLHALSLLRPEDRALLRSNSSADPEAKTYRTYRPNRDLQIWFVEGRDYRDPNKMPDGPEKTLWGAQQIAWLKRTLLESDATFRLSMTKAGDWTM